MQRVLALVDRVAILLVSWRPPWWAWPAALVGLAAASDLAALFFRPLDASWVAWPWGAQLGDTCGMIVATGHPCPQCGMTRSWVHGIRGDLVAAWLYNPAGLALWLWINAAGLIGAVRLFTRSPRRLEAPVWLLVGWVSLWLVGLYLGGYVLRLGGINPLP